MNITRRFMLFDLIAEYIPTDKTIWCPFDTEQSNYVKVFKNRGNKVINSHIIDGKDFFTYAPDSNEYDYIISNPPYSKRNEVYTRLFELKKPFAMLVSFVALFDTKYRFNLFSNNNFELLIPDKRIRCFTDYNIQNCKNTNPPFKSVYVTSGIFNKQINFKRVS